LRLLMNGHAAWLARDRPGDPRLGLLINPRGGHGRDSIEAARVPWAVDNDAFKSFDEARFLRALASLSGLPGCLWVATPDIVGDASRTLALFSLWEPRIRALGYPVALVAQDGLESLPIPWDRLDAVFLGGSTEWKLSLPAEEIGFEAKARGKHLHMGRVNSAKRLRHAFEIGCDTVDGTSYSAFRDVNLPKAMRSMRRLERTPCLF